MSEDPYAISDGERAELMAWIGSLDVPAALQKILAKSIDAELIEDAWCSKCGGRVPVRYPDRKGAAAFIKLLFDYKLLKPSDQIRQQSDVNVHVTLATLHELPMERLAAIAAGADVVDAEFTEHPPELPPAA